MSEGGRPADALTLGAVALMVMLTMSWGLGQAAMKAGSAGFSPVFQTVARSAIAALLVFLWSNARGIELFRRDGTLLPGLAAGLLFGTEFLLLYGGLDRTTASRGVLFLYSMPFWVMVGAHFLLGERMSWRKVAAMALAFAGLAIAFSDTGSRPAPDAWRGDLMMLAAAVLWAATTLVIRSTRLAKAPAEKVLLYQLAVSAAMAAPLLLGGGPHLRTPDFISVSALGFQAVWVVAVTYVIWFWLVGRYPAASLSAFTFLTPVFGVLAGAILLGEPLSPRIFAALALIALALAWANWRAGRIRLAKGSA